MLVMLYYCNVPCLCHAPVATGRELYCLIKLPGLSGFFFSGGECRPCMSFGASAAGVLSVAARTWRRNSAHTPAALDGPPH